MRSTTFWVGLGGWVLAGVAVGGCGSSHPSASGVPKAASAPVAVKASCARQHPAVGARRHGGATSSASVALARGGSGVIAYVADADEPTLHTVDIEGGREIAVTDLRGKPEQVMVLADGRVAVTIRGGNGVEILEPKAAASEALESRCMVETAAEPIAMAETPDGATLVVTSAWDHKLSGFETATFTRKYEVEVAREPRQVVLSDDGKRAFVSHLVNAQMSVVDLDTDKHDVRQMSQALRKVDPITPGQVVAKGSETVRKGCQGYALAKSVSTEPDAPEVPMGEAPPVVITPPQPIAPNPQPAPKPQVRPQPSPVVPGRVFGPMVTVNPGESQRIAYYGSNDGLATEVSHVSVVDASAERVMTRSVLNLRKGGGKVEVGECLLPRSAAFSNGSLYVTCLGIDTLVEYDARALDPSKAETRRWSVPAGPTGVAIEPTARRAVVWSQFDRSLAIVALKDAGDQDLPVQTVALSRKAGFGLVGDAALGRVLYHKSGDARMSVEGMACASCHPDGREDALTWGTLDGPRQTPMLAARLDDTGPYSWNGAHQTVEIHLKDTIQRLRGTGLRESEVHAIAQYIKTMDAPNAKHDLTAARAKQAQTGKELFFSAETACTTCHQADRGWTDGLTHDVGSVSVLRNPNDPKEKLLDTPSLKFVSGTAPYFHDGRYSSLQEMLDSPEHAMGYSMNLSREQRVALTVFLETL